MLRVRINAKSSARCSAFSLMLRTCSWLLVLHGPVEGQFLQSPCPNVFSSQFDAGSNQWVGYIQLQGIRIGQLVKLNVDLSIGFPTSQNNVGSIRLVKSSEETLRDIENNLPAQYRVDIWVKNVIPSLSAIRVNDETICFGRPAAGNQLNNVSLQHAFLAQTVSLWNYNRNGNNVNINNVRVIQSEPSETQGRRIRFQILPNLVVPAFPVGTDQPAIAERTPPVQALPSVNYNSAEEDIGCGTPAHVFKFLSINGTRSSKGQFPWASPIFAYSGSKPRYICGSTIISTTHLVTAAHCMFLNGGVKLSPYDLLTVPGMYNIDNFLDGDLQARKVVSIAIHDDYYFDDTGLAESDLAVMKVDQPLVYNNLVRPICLWSDVDNLEQIVGVKGYVSGWGVTESGEAKYPSYVTSTVVDRRSCSRNLEKGIIGFSRLFCGDGNGSVPCNGDSGSGFVIKRGTKFFLRGIVSVGQFDPNTLTCAHDKYVLYTDIAPLRHWLSEVLKKT